MSDWQPGDLALCVKGGFRGGMHEGVIEYPTSGMIYTVQQPLSYSFSLGEKPALEFIDAPQNFDGRRVWAAYRFIKLRDHEPDAEDAETIRLLNGAPVEPITVSDATPQNRIRVSPPGTDTQRPAALSLISIAHTGEMER